MAEMQSARVCFIDYVKRPNSLTEIATFCRVKPETVLTWQDGTWPRGEQLYRLWAFLELHGYKPSELEELPRPTYQLLLIIGVGLLEFDGVQRELGYENLQSLYRLFRDGVGLTKERAWRLEEMVKSHLPALEEARRNIGPSSADDTERISHTDRKPVSVVQPTSAGVRQWEQPEELSSLARLLRLVVRRSAGIAPDELKRQLKDVPREEIEAFALLLLELV